MRFKDIIGQHELKKQLIQSVNEGRISHAQLFLGQEGSGNLPLAIAYARYIVCEHRGATDSCGECLSCLKYNHLAHPDLHFAFPVSTTREVTSRTVSDKFLNQWREALLQTPYLNLFHWLQFIGVENKQGIIGVDESNNIIKKLSLKTFEAPYKVMIIWMAEKLNAPAANKLLKILEEPTDKTLFLLVCESTEQLLPTILSRTQIIKVNKISTQDIIKSLAERNELGMDEIEGIAHLADGNYLQALKMIDEKSEENYNQDTFRQWMRLCYSKDIIAIINWVDETAKIGRERQKNFLRYGLHVFRECLMINYAGEEMARLSENEQEFSRKFSRFVNETNCYELTEEFEKAIFHIERNANPKILFLDLSIKTVTLLNRKPAEQV